MKFQIPKKASLRSREELTINEKSKYTLHVSNFQRKKKQLEPIETKVEIIIGAKTFPPVCKNYKKPINQVKGLNP